MARWMIMGRNTLPLSRVALQSQIDTRTIMWVRLQSGHVRVVSQIEAFRQLKVQLNGGALMETTQSVFDGDVNFWAVERAIAQVQLPRVSKLFESSLKFLEAGRYKGHE